MPSTFAVDAGRTSGEISPLWFGHNLEHTRSCVWRGLSAQVVRNRKFTGLPHRRGTASQWHGIGQAACWYVVQEPWGHKGTGGEPYTATFDGEAPRAAGFRQRIECVRPGMACGIGQSGIPLTGGRGYEGRVALRSDRELTVRIAVPGTFECQRRVEPGGWHEVEFRFEACEDTGDATLAITFEEPGNLYVGMVSLLPEGHFHGLRRDVVELLREIAVPLLRWPGGNFAGDYRWQDGLLPRDRRAPLPSPHFTQPHTAGFDNHEIGTDEYIALCRELGAEPFITINMSTQGPEDAAAWVEYCNGAADTTWGRRRAERGHPEPYAVTHWTLGNEMGYTHMAGTDTAGEYVKAAAECARAMRAVDPSLVLTASSAWHYDWYRDVLLAEVGDFQNISHHTYDCPVRTFVGEEALGEFRQLAAAPDVAFHGTCLVDGRQGEGPLTMRDMRQLIDQRPGNRPPVGIAFDEWNVWYSWYRRPGVSEGIYAALMLNLFCRDARRLGMRLGAYFEPVNEGAILVGLRGAHLTPVGQAVKLFRPHHGGQLIEVAPATADEVDIAASVDAGGGCVTITLVNPSPCDEHAVEVSVRGAVVDGPARGVLLSAANFLPGSQFTETELDLTWKDDATLALVLPRHSVARVRFDVARA